MTDRPIPGLELRGVGKRFGDRTVLSDVTLSVGGGEIVSILGRSGSGKTTLLRIVAGLEIPDEGAVHLAGGDVTRTRPGDRGVGMVFQHPALLPHLDVAANIGFADRGIRRRHRTPPLHVVDAAEATGCRDLLARHPDTLSGGERQRVALARALARSPEVLLLDEPLAGLDVGERVAVRVAARRALVAARVTALHVTHDQSEAFAMGDRVAVVDEGRLVQVGSPDELLDAPATLGVARLVSSTRSAFVPTTVAPDGLDAGPFRLAGHPAGAGAAATVAAIRAADVKVTDGDPATVGADDRVVGTVVSCDVHDDSAVAHVDVGDGVVVAVEVDRRRRPTVGTSLSLRRVVAGSLLFDALTGDRLPGDPT